MIPELERLEPTVLLLVATALYLGYHYGGLALRDAHKQRILGFALLGVIPAILTELYLPGGLAAHGLAHRDAGPSGAFLALVGCVVVPVVVLAARSPKQWEHYPQIRRERWTPRDHMANAATWGLYLLGYELFFRGVLTFALARELGAWPGLAVMTALYVAVHLPKPAGETVGTLPMGLIFGLTALASGGIWAPWIGHWVIAVTSDVATSTFAGRARARGPARA